MVLKSVGVLSVGKVFACLYALLGLIFGGLVLLFTLASVAIGGKNAEPAAAFVGVMMFFCLPIGYGLVGFIGGAITALLYNLVAAFAGGIEMELQQSANDRLQ